MAWDRNQHVEALLKEKIALVVLGKLSDPRLGFVTITDVKLSKDKRHAKVLYTVLGNAAQRRTTERALRDAAPHVQRQIAPGMHLRKMPELRFAYDESIEKGSRVLDILDELAGTRVQAPKDGGPDDDEPPEEAGDVDEPDDAPPESGSADDDDDDDDDDDKEGDDDEVVKPD